LVEQPPDFIDTVPLEKRTNALPYCIQVDARR
jgi:hypothetical protein